MIKSDKLIDRFFEYEEQVWKLAGCDEVQYPGLTDGRHYKFCLTDDDIIFGDPDDKDDQYSGEIYGTAIFRGEHYTIAVYDNGCGDRKCPILLDNSKSVPEWNDAESEN